ncbi:TonB-dependent receptor [Acetobacteraceae bacterium ESL0709]|nr:TonB-dependent receptor [Acetobacteraceae bacterium ESL0697]MDF7678932.1 TonB-dependent receptor [Acetobacteraceae bacterium ESL0709]
MSAFSSVFFNGFLQHRKISVCLFLISSSFLSLSASARAESTGPDNEKSHPKEETITVTRQREHFSQAADTTALFRDVPGFSSYSAGGLSSLPVLNGMADDRLASYIDGIRVGADCPNHMNPAFSQIDMDSIASSQAASGVSSVNIGGDSIGGSLSVERKDPQFAQKGKILVTGQGRADWRSNGGGSGAAGSVTVANDTLSMRYTASYSHASDYTAGGRGGHVASTSYLSYNHAVTAGWHHENHMFALTFGQQDMPYQGFPNQYMDETNNRSTFVNGKYLGNFDWGTLDVRGFWKRIDHAMNMMSDKGGHTATTGMPMNIASRNVGYSIKATIPLTLSQTLQVGSEFQHNGLNDWWPPLQGSMMMGPGTFHNLNDAHRDHLGHFIQLNSHWTSRFSTEIGMRSDLVMMNTGRVSSYNDGDSMSMMHPMTMMNMGMGSMHMGGMGADDAQAAKAFNTAKRGRTDANFDATVILRYKVTDYFDVKGGYARKTRSPNLYERYAWGRSSMASRMIGWFGDGNGYVGNLRLKPEIANNASVTFHFHDPREHGWDLTIEPYFSHIHNYVNVEKIAHLSNGFNQLRFVNHTAQTYGINATGRLQLWNNSRFGAAHLMTSLNWVRGQDKTSHTGLYQQMPLNGIIGLHESFGHWTGRAEITLVKAKTTVDSIRSEARTPGYALLGLGAGYRWRTMRLDIGLENLLNQRYFLPLGGRMVTEAHAAGTLPAPVLAMGRSVNLTLRGSF